ncbi:hypothetical protein TNCV_4358361, partial [Trichonephila clavipes]
MWQRELIGSTASAKPFTFRREQLASVVIIYRFWNSGAGGAACKQKWVEVPRSEPGR